MAQSCHPSCQRAFNEKEEHDASVSAAIVALNLISSTRLLLKLDDEFTEYSAQYLVENALPKNDEQHCELTVKDCLKFALKEGIPKAENWAHLGCVFKPPPFACHIPRISTKGEVIETKVLEEALELLQHQPVGARLHVFSPDIDRVGDGVYTGSANGSGGSRYVGLRDVMIFGVVKKEGDTVAEVKICYKKKTRFMSVSLTLMFLTVALNGDESKAIEPTGLLVDFCSPRLSIN